MALCASAAHPASHWRKCGLKSHISHSRNSFRGLCRHCFAVVVSGGASRPSRRSRATYWRRHLGEPRGDARPSNWTVLCFLRCLGPAPSAQRNPRREATTTPSGTRAGGSLRAGKLGATTRCVSRRTPNWRGFHVRRPGAKRAPARAARRSKEFAAALAFHPGWRSSPTTACARALCRAAGGAGSRPYGDFTLETPLSDAMVAFVRSRAQEKPPGEGRCQQRRVALGALADASYFLVPHEKDKTLQDTKSREGR